MFVINLGRNPARLGHILPSVRAPGLPWERVAAVDGKALSTTQIAATTNTQRYQQIMKHAPTVGTLGCYLSHLEVLRHFLASCHDYALVLEDDISFDPTQLRNGLLFAVHNAQLWDVVNIEIAYSGTPLSITDDHNRAGSYLAVYLTEARHAGAYLINRQAARLYMEKALPIIMPFDHFYTRAWEFGLRFTGLENP